MFDEMGVRMHLVVRFRLSVDVISNSHGVVDPPTTIHTGIRQRVSKVSASSMKIVLEGALLVRDAA
jgi:hypothetical protein